MPEHITNELEIYIDERNCNKEKYQDLSEEEKKSEKGFEKDIKILLKKNKKKKRQYRPEANKSLSEEQKQKLVEHKTNYYVTDNN